MKSRTDRFKTSVSIYQNLIRKKIRDYIGYPVIKNIANQKCIDKNKRILFIYITKPYRIKKDSPAFFAHQNLKQCAQIITLLNDRGYTVDLADINDHRHKIEGDYEAVISHKPLLDDQLIKIRSKNHIYLATGVPHSQHNSELIKRHQYLFERRAIQLPIKGLNSELMPYVSKTNSIACFGNSYVKTAWTTTFNKNSYNFFNYGFDGTKFLGETKNFEKNKRNFLFFSSNNQVAKGLDLLLDTFSQHPELNLFVCSLFLNEKDFCQVYHKELFQTPNIHPIGWVQVNSQQFYKICENCTFIIHPSCSEGSPGSVIQSMHTGLIPVLTKQSGIDSDSFGYILSNDTVEVITETINLVSQCPTNDLQEKTYLTRTIAADLYSESAFINRWNEILDIVL